MTNHFSGLANKKVVVLGGSAGIGLAAVQAAVSEGAEVVIVSSNPARIAEALQHMPASTKGHAADLRNEEAVRNLFETVGAFDHLVFTAGENLRLRPVADTPVDEAREFFNLRFWSAFSAVKWGTPHINPGGSITLTSGTAGRRPAPGWSVASAICSAMEGFVKALAVELAPVRVNCVVPGMIRTELWGSIAPDAREHMFSSVAQALPVKRIGEPEDVGQGFLYLMKQTFVTGQSLVIDGGTLLV